MKIVNYSPDLRYNLPIYGAGLDIPKGALLMRGATPATDNGALILATSAAADSIGILGELHDYSVTGDSLVAGTNFVTHPVEPLTPWRIVRIDYSLASSDLITCTEAVNSTTMTVASLEDNIDTAFVYVAAGLGIGQTNYLTASASGSCTLKAAFGTSLDTTSMFVKILPRFHPLAVLTSDGTKLSSTDAVGTWTVCIIDNYILRVNGQQQLDPTKHSALTGLNNDTSLRFIADVAIRNTQPYSID